MLTLTEVMEWLRDAEEDVEGVPGPITVELELESNGDIRLILQDGDGRFSYGPVIGSLEVNLDC